MSKLIAIGYPNEVTAARAARDAQGRPADLMIQPDALAIVVRDREGEFHVTTNHHAVAGGATYGMLWGPIFMVLFFVPVLGLTTGAGLGALTERIAQSGMDCEFQDRVGAMLQPGTSALFLLVDKVSADKVISALSPFRGTVFTASLSGNAERDLQEALHGSGGAAVSHEYEEALESVSPD